MPRKLNPTNKGNNLLTNLVLFLLIGLAIFYFLHYTGNLPEDLNVSAIQSKIQKLITKDKSDPVQHSKQKASSRSHPKFKTDDFNWGKMTNGVKDFVKEKLPDRSPKASDKYSMAIKGNTILPANIIGKVRRKTYDANPKPHHLSVPQQTFEFHTSYYTEQQAMKIAQTKLHRQGYIKQSIPLRQYRYGSVNVIEAVNPRTNREVYVSMKPTERNHSTHWIYDFYND